MTIRAPMCTAHSEVAAVARCQRCNDALCGDCFRLLAAGAPICDRCAVELERGPGSRWPFAIAFGAIGIAIAVWGVRVVGDDGQWIFGVAGVLTLIIALIIGLTGSKPNTAPPPAIQEREIELEPTSEMLAQARHPYRARISRVAQRIVPLSGRSTAMLLTAAFFVSAVAVPASLRLPHWIEAELVLGVWWVCVFALLTILLYRGLRLAEDHRVRVDAPNSTKTDGNWLSSFGDLGGSAVDGEGCAVAIVLALIVAVAAVLAWALVEIVLPILVFAVYYFVVKSIGRVARDRHGCEGKLGKSLAWGALWSALYMLPVATLVWMAHALLKVKSAG